MSNQDNRRQFLRVPAHIKVHMSTTSSDREMEYDVTSHDLSANGIALIVPSDVRPVQGDEIQMSFRLSPDKPEIHLRGQVVRVGKLAEDGDTILSCRFISVDNEVEKQLVRYTFIRQQQLVRPRSFDDEI